MMDQTFISEMEEKLKGFETKLAQLAACPKSQNDKARLEREKRYHVLRTRQDALRDEIRKAALVPGDEWGAFKASLEKTYEGMVRTMDETLNRIDGPEDAGLY